MVHEYFAYWNADSVALVLNWVAALMGGNDYLGLVRTVGIVGLLACAAGIFARFRGEEFASYLLVFAMLNGVLLVPKITVNVIDVRTGSTYAVSNVPFGVGYFSAHMSRVGKWLTESFENIALPTSATRFSQTGFMFGARLIRENLSVNLPPGALYSDIIDFLNYCVNPELVNNPSIMSELIMQQDLFGYLGGSGTLRLNPGRYLNISTNSAGAVSCTDAYEIIVNELDNVQVVGLRDRLSTKLNAGAVNAHLLLATQTPAFETMLFGTTGRSADLAIRQGVALNMMIEGQSSISSMLDDSSGLKIALSQAFRQANMSSSLMSEIANSALPKFRNAIELMIIGMFPVVGLLILVAGVKGGLVLRSYLMSIVWVQLWAPMYALANYAGLLAMGVEFSGLRDENLLPTLANMGDISSAAITCQTVAGVLALSTPAIAMALVKAGEAGLSSTVASAMGSVSGGVSQAAGAAASGNVSIGNVQWGNESYMNSTRNNTSANKHQQGGSVESGSKASYTNEHGTAIGSTNGMVSAYQAVKSDGGALSVVASNDNSRKASASSGTAVEHGTDKSSVIASSSAAVLQASKDAGFMRQLGATLQEMNALDVGGGFKGSASNSGNFGSSNNVGTGADVSEAFKVSSGLGLSLGGGSGGGSGGGGAASLLSSLLPVKAGMNADANSTTTKKDAAGAQITASNQQATAQQYDTVIAGLHKLAGSTTDAQTKSKAERLASALTEMKSAMLSESARMSESERAGTNVSDDKSGGIRVGQDLAGQVFDKLNPGGSWGGATNALRQASQATPAAVSAAQQVAQAQSEKPNAIGSKDGVAPPPKTQEEVKEAGERDVREHADRGKGNVNQQKGKNDGKVEEFLPKTDAREQPSLEGVAAQVQSLTGLSNERVNSQEQRQNLATAIGALTSAKFKDENGASQTFSNAFLGGLGYESPMQVHAAIGAAAVKSPEFSSKLVEAGAQVRAGKQLSDAQLEELGASFKAASSESAPQAAGVGRAGQGRPKKAGVGRAMQG